MGNIEGLDSVLLFFVKLNSSGGLQITISVLRCRVNVRGDTKNSKPQGKFKKAVKVSSDSDRMMNRSINRPVVKIEAKLRSVTLLVFCLLLIISPILRFNNTQNRYFTLIIVHLLIKNVCTDLFCNSYRFKFNWGKAEIFLRQYMHKCLLLIDDLCTSICLSVTRCLCLLPGSCNFTSGVVRLRGESQLTVVTRANRWTIGTKETLNGESASLWPHLPAQKQTVVGHVTQPRLPVYCMMSVSAPKGLASSGQKPITEITHPLSTAEEPLSISVNAGGEKVSLLGASRCSWNMETGPKQTLQLEIFRLTTVGSNPRTSTVASVLWFFFKAKFCILD